MLVGQAIWLPGGARLRAYSTGKFCMFCTPHQMHVTMTILLPSEVKVATLIALICKDVIARSTITKEDIEASVVPRPFHKTRLT